MNLARLVLAMAVSAIVLGSHGFADETNTDGARFAPPERIEAGGKFLGEGRYYPSPVLYDLDGDKRLDILVGDLIGKVTVAQRRADMFAAEEPLNGRDGKPLKFENW